MAFSTFLIHSPGWIVHGPYKHYRYSWRCCQYHWSYRKTINKLRDIHDRWKDADLTIINLISQLTSLRAALNKISEWISSDLADIPQHHQLVMDLEDSVTCCWTLIKLMDNQVSKLNWTVEDDLDIGSRLKVVLEDKASKEFQRFIKRQTSALVLLLTACNWWVLFLNVDQCSEADLVPSVARPLLIRNYYLRGQQVVKSLKKSRMTHLRS